MGIIMQRFLLPFVCLASAVFAAPPDLLKTLQPAHPRLIATDTDIARVRSLIRHDPRAQALYQRLRREAEKIEASPTVEYKLIGPRLLRQSRLCLRRVYTLALLYRVDGEKWYLRRAVKELRAAANFPDWHPPHFLDTAEMTHAFAIGYDWLYPALSEEQRSWIRRALVEKGLKAAEAAYERGAWWVKSPFNWNQVCNGGIGVGALAVADEEPELCRRLLRHAVTHLPLAMQSYSPDGGWAEGPGYWRYATSYTVYFLAALKTALGTDFGLSDEVGFRRAGHFRVYSSGPAGETFNYADAGSRIGTAAAMFWLARRFLEPVYCWQERRQLQVTGGGDPLDLVWFCEEAKTPREDHWPLDTWFQGVNVAFLRSSWDDPDAIFVGVKGGDNKANHSHLDLGTFVLDAGGKRWAIDLGPDNYNLPRYFGSLRWSYYRLRTESHNTMLIDGLNQDPKAAAPIVENVFQPGMALVRVDLSAAYPGKVTQLERTLALVDRRVVVIQDKVRAAQPVEALWGMVTDAGVHLMGRTAELRKPGWVLEARILSPENAEFSIVSTQPPSPQKQNLGTKKLVVRLPGRVTSADVIVQLTPYKENAAKPVVKLSLPL